MNKELKRRKYHTLQFQLTNKNIPLTMCFSGSKQFKGHRVLTSDLAERRKKYANVMTTLIHRYLRPLETGMAGYKELID